MLLRGLSFLASPTAKIATGIVAVIAFAIGWTLHGWIVSGPLRSDLAEAREDLAVSRASVATLDAALAEQSAAIDGMALAAERLTQDRADAVRDALASARRTPREAVKGVEAWNASVAD